MSNGMPTAVEMTTSINCETEGNGNTRSTENATVRSNPIRSSLLPA